MRFVFAALIGFILAQCCAAQTMGGYVDPNYISPQLSTNPLNINVNGVALRSQTVNTSIANLVLIVAGQSNLTDVAPSLFSPVNGSALDAMNINDGAIYAAVDPLPGCSLTFSGGNPALRLADALVTGGFFARVIIAPIAIGNTAVADWATGADASRFAVIMQRLAARGITPAMTNVTFAVIWGQGENDTNIGTSQASYTASLNAVISASRAAGMSGRWFVAEQSWNGNMVSSAVEAAQAAVVNNPSGVYVGPNADALIGSACSGVACRQSLDPGGSTNLHFSDAGSASYASAWQTSMHASGSPF